MDATPLDNFLAGLHAEKSEGLLNRPLDPRNGPPNSALAVVLRICILH